MNINEAIEIVHDYNKWYKGADIPEKRANSKLLSKALDVIIVNYYTNNKTKEQTFTKNENSS